MKPIYLDYASTTPVGKRALSVAAKYYSDVFYNPSSVHVLGQAASSAVERARKKCADAINGEPRGIYFTSGGTEAINTAIKCFPFGDKKRIVVSSIEHDAVISCAEALKKCGIAVEYARPDRSGIITPSALERVMTDDTALVCVMTVNNIVGTVQPIKELAEVAHKFGALFFTDAVQAVNGIKIDVKDSGADMLCVSGHKFYAPKGVGFLYVKPSVRLSPLIEGGGQERRMRAGTVDVPSAVAMGEAITEAAGDTVGYNAHVKAVSEAFVNKLKYGDPVAYSSPRVPDILSVAFDGVNGSRLAVALSMAGVCCSVGSACSAGSEVPPATLTEMGIDNADCAVRFSFGRNLSVTRAIEAARIVNSVVKKLTENKDKR